jgi:hypothetical protein
MTKLLTLAAGIVAAFALMVAPASAITGNWVEDNTHTYVGLVAFYDSHGVFMWRCSGSLITPTTFLTAGHCTDQNAAESPASARIWFHQNVGGGYNPPTVNEDPNTGYPNRCLPGDPLCVEATKLYDYGFDNFAGFPNNHDVGLVVLDQPLTSVGYGKLAQPGALDTLLTQRGRQDTVFTPSGYGVSYTNPTRTVSFRERLMAETILVNLNSANAGGFNLQLSSAPAQGRGGTCFGDSGGPVHWGGFSSTTIVGVNSFVLNNNCAGVGFAYRVDSAAVQNWILGVIGATEFAKIQFAS